MSHIKTERNSKQIRIIEKLYWKAGSVNNAKSFQLSWKIPPSGMKISGNNIETLSVFRYCGTSSNGKFPTLPLDFGTGYMVIAGKGALEITAKLFPFCLT